MATKLTFIDENMLKIFYRERAQDLKIQNDEPQEAVSKNEALRNTLMVQLYAYCHYLQADYRKSDTLQAGTTFVGKKERASIAGIFPAVSEDGESAGFDLLVPLSWKKEITPSDFRNEIKKRYENCVSFLKGIKGLSSDPGPLELRLRKLGFTRLDEQKPVTIRFLVDASPSPANREKIDKWLGGDLQDVEIDCFVRWKIYYASDIEYEVNNTASAFQFVPSGELELDKPENVCQYNEGCCRAISANIRARSLQRLWRDTSNKGLLAQNLRYYVKEARVDSAMINTMFNAPKQFWYFNNGLTIVCKSFQVDGKRLRLEQFSIVNGGQTTHNIGTAGDLRNDFALPCKIVAMQDAAGHPLDSDEQVDMIADICTATNSQKAIKAADAVANRKEIRELRRALKAEKACPICLTSKKGEQADRTAYPARWQVLKTPQYGQLLLSFLYQSPCTARNKTKELFEDELLFQQLFSPPSLPVAFVRDLIRLQWAIRDYKKLAKVPKAEKTRVKASDEQWQKYHLLANGEYLLLACVGVLCKLLANPYLEHEIQETSVSACPRFLNKCDAAYPFLGSEGLTPAGDDSSLFDLFDFCMDTFIYPGYRSYCERTGREGDYSNFAKSDTRYVEYVQHAIVKRIHDGLEDSERERIHKVLRTPSPEERNVIVAVCEQHPLRWSAEYVAFNREQCEDILAKLKVYMAGKKPRVKMPPKKALKDLIAKVTVTPHDLEAQLEAPQIAAYGDHLLELLEEVERKRAGLSLREPNPEMEEDGDDGDEEE